MKFLKWSAALAVLLAIFAPGTLTEIRHTAATAASSFMTSASASTEPGHAGKDYADRDAHRLACALFSKWSKADATTRAGSTKFVAALATEASGKTDDPAAKALLGVVPAAVGHGSSVPTRSAQLLLKRECRLAS